MSAVFPEIIRRMPGNGWKAEPIIRKMILRRNMGKHMAAEKEGRICENTEQYVYVTRYRKLRIPMRRKNESR